MKRCIKINLLLVMFLLICTSCSEHSEENGKAAAADFQWVKIQSDGNNAAAAELEAGVFGRYFYSGDSAVFEWPANGIRFGFTGTSLSIEFGESNAGVAVYVDDFEEQYYRVKEKRTVSVASDLDPNMIHNVTIMKRSEPNKGNLVINSFTIDENGEFYIKKYEKQRKKIEVIGDSIACGYGNLYGTVDGDHIDMEDGSKTFTTMLAEEFNAELSVCAISGIGIGKDGGYPLPILPEYKNDGDIPHDFSGNIPDLVIIELGTNDDSCGNSGDEFTDGAKELVSFVRSNYPDAAIIWFYGIMGDGAAETIQNVVKYFTDCGDSNIYYLQTSQNPEEPIGEKGHPSLETHIRMKNELVKFIDEKLNF